MKEWMGAVACGVGLFLFTACGDAVPPATPATPATPSGAMTFSAQAAEGQKLYAAKCASCHGASGEGSNAPRLVGIAQGALPLEPPHDSSRKMKFQTAADVAGFVVKEMPPGEVGKLTDAQYWEILAFDLKANGIDLGTKHLDGTTAPSVVIHP